MSKQKLSGPNQLFVLQEPLYLGLLFGKVLQSVSRQVIGNIRAEVSKGVYNSTLVLGTRSNPEAFHLRLSRLPWNNRLLSLNVSSEYRVGERGRRVLERLVFDEES